jgi:glycosyltransferase involved in cell wall biosynthesis
MKIAVLGNIAGVAQEVVVGLRESGIEADLFMTRREFVVANDDLSGQLDFLGARVRILDAGQDSAGFGARLISLARKSFLALTLMRYDLIHSHTGSLCWSILPYLLYVRGHLRPYLAFATGSDFRETARNDAGRNGDLMRAFFRQADEVLLLNNDMLLFKDEMGFDDARFFPFVINEQKFAPRPLSRAEGPRRLELFMTSSFDFGINDNGPGRNSTKSNDNVLRALALFVAGGGRAHLVAVDRGPDREIAKLMVQELNLTEHITFKPPLSEEERRQHMAAADVVLDQFHLGAFGLGALEAMSMGRPLITYVHPKAFAMSYGERPEPFINARRPEQICDALWKLCEPSVREELSVQARAFIVQCHSRDAVIPQLVELYRQHLRQMLRTRRRSVRAYCRHNH